MVKRYQNIIKNKYIVLLIILLFFIIIRLPYVNSYLFLSDEAVFLTLADNINRGDIIYKDTWDFKPPLIYIVFAFLIKYFPHDILTIKIFTMVVFILTSIVLFFLSGRIFNTLTSYIIIILYCLYSSSINILGFSSVCEIFTVLVTSLSLLLILICLDETQISKRRSLLFLSGILLGIGFFLKYNIIFEMILSLIYICYISYMQKSQINKKECYFILNGFLFFSLIMLIYLIYIGAFTDYMKTIFYLRNYISLTAKPRILDSIIYTFTKSKIFILILFSLSSCIYAVFYRKDYKTMVIVLWVIGGIISKYVTNSYFMLLLPGCCIASGFLIEHFLLNWRKLRYFILILIVIFSINSYVILKQHIINVIDLSKLLIVNKRYFDREIIENVGLYIKDKTNDKDHIYVVSDYGLRDLLYFISRRKCCTKYPGFLIMNVIVPSEIKEDQISSFKSHPPKYFIVWSDKQSFDYFNYLALDYIKKTDKEYFLEEKISDQTSNDIIFLYKLKQ